MNVEPIVYFVEEDSTARDSLVQLASTEGFTAQAFQSAESFTSHYQPTAPGCVVTDIRLPGITGIQLHRWINEQQHPLAVIYLTAHADVPTTVQAMKLGAHEVLQKPCPTFKLVENIRQAFSKGRSTFERYQRRQQAQELLRELSPEEYRVLELMFLGRTNQEIAKKLSLSLRTVQFRRSSIFRKTAIPTKSQLFDRLFNIGWLPNQDDHR